MFKTLLIGPITLLCSLKLFAQIPIGQCGLLYTYDASGNRIKQEYYCNNVNPSMVNEQKKEIAKDNTAFIEVDALYPNPTSGKLYITFSVPLLNAGITVFDMNGRTVRTFKGSGQKIEINLADCAAGAYNIYIYDDKKVITKRVVKQ